MQKFVDENACWDESQFEGINKSASGTACVLHSKMIYQLGLNFLVDILKKVDVFS